MASHKKLVLFLAVSLAGQVFSLPAPQVSSNTIPGSSDDVTPPTEVDEDYYYYDDYDENDSSPGLPDLSGLITAIGSQVPGLINLIQTKVAIVNTILNNKEFQERVGETIEVGGNLFQRIVIPVASRAIPIAIDLIGKVPDLIQAGQGALAAGNQALGTLTRTPEFQKETSKGGTQEMLASGSRVLGSLVKATNDTAPRVIKGLTELNEQLPLFTGFARAYAEVNAKEAQETAETFHRSFNCDFQCRGLAGSIRRRCESKYCKKIRKTP
eukprot:TRINITY_DN11802_c0_g1_i1.p1 TRINITY_DN11802_c0_g1~~TRINITY_DN11802_c0_g1_i1.p1  ORF type:complete len:269 (+),score=77.43 TRINITY_DN11802_c0_g1_i1:118-924(+)